MKKLFYLSLLVFAAACSGSGNEEPGTDAPQAILFKNANVLIGDGSASKSKTDILVKNGTILNVGANLEQQGAESVDLSGKTIIPALVSTHVHVGTLKDTTSNGSNYNRDNILRQLKKYADYGILNVLCLGTDRPALFQHGLYDSVKNGLNDGARMLSAGYGFNVPVAKVDVNASQGVVYRPSAAAQVPAEMDSLATLGVTIVKIWVDDFNKTVPKMDTAVYHAIINEAHKRNLKVAAHVYYLADARRLVDDGVDFLAHSIRDSVVDDSFLAMMKQKNVVYIPTLVLEKFANAYAEDVPWMNDPFFRSSLEPGVYEMIASENYKATVKNSAGYARSVNAYKISSQNAKKIFNYGIKVALGTDSGAFPVRTQGFSEHLELQLMVEAGISPLQVITIATLNSAEALGLNNFGTLEKGKAADILVLNGDPSADIKNTTSIFAIYKSGKKVK